jgi:hypothetical protein
MLTLSGETLVVMQTLLLLLATVTFWLQVTVESGTEQALNGVPARGVAVPTPIEIHVADAMPDMISEGTPTHKQRQTVRHRALAFL